MIDWEKFYDDLWRRQDPSEPPVDPVPEAFRAGLLKAARMARARMGSLNRKDREIALEDLDARNALGDFAADLEELAKGEA